MEKDAAAVELAAMIGAWRDLALRWDLDYRERRMLLPAGGEEAEQPPEDTERRMRICIEIGYRIRFEDDEQLVEWLREPSELWAWHTPLEVMSGTLADLRRFRGFVEMGMGS